MEIGPLNSVGWIPMQKLRSMVSMCLLRTTCTALGAFRRRICLSPEKTRSWFASSAPFAWGNRPWMPRLGPFPPAMRPAPSADKPARPHARPCTTTAGIGDPRLATSGIWKPVRWVRTDTEWPTFRLVVESADSVQSTCVLHWDEPLEGIASRLTLADRDVSHVWEQVDSVTHRLTIADPELWWPQGMGNQPIYDLELQGGLAPQPCEVRSAHFGMAPGAGCLWPVDAMCGQWGSGADSGCQRHSA